MVPRENLERAQDSTENSYNTNSDLNAARRIAIDLAVGGNEQTPTEGFVESLIHKFVSKYGTKPIVEAKEEFFLSSGKIFAEDDNYHQRIYYFLNHFIFERPLPNSNRVTPFLDYLELCQDTPVIEGYTHSLFHILKVRPDHIYLKDIISEKKLKVSKQELEVFEGITKGDHFQGILLHQGITTYLTRGLIFHPTRAHKAIQGFLKKERKKQIFSIDQLLFALARQQLKHTRLKHVDPKIVYQENPFPMTFL